MWLLFAVLLRVLHFFYATTLAMKSLWKRHSTAAPLPLSASRRRIPNHLAIVFAVDPSLPAGVIQEVLTESVVDAATWCRTVGVKKLTVYEERDLLSKCVSGIHERLPIQSAENYSSESDTEYPITPPPSDYADSRPLSPDLHSKENTLPVTTIHVGAPSRHGESNPALQRRRRQQKREDPLERNLLLCIASRESSKPSIANIAQNLARKAHKTNCTREVDAFEISVAELGQLLEDDDRLSAPDFMIVHHIEPPGYVSMPLELHGFPPWHIRLTEIYHSKPHKSIVQKWLSPHWPQAFSLDETSFRASLDEFASAEMRFGK